MLASYLDQADSRGPFDWRTYNCSHFAAGWWQAYTGVDALQGITMPASANEAARFLARRGGTLVDLKSTRDPSPRRFSASAAQFGYDLQMALYAGAESIIIWPENRWDEAELIPLPEVDQTEAVIIHLPSTEPANCSVRYLDLEIGREHLELCGSVRAVRRLKPLLRRVGAVNPDKVDTPGSKRDELLGRVKAVKATSATAVDDLALFWPADVPTFKGGHEHTDAELAAIETVLARIEANHGIPFLVPPYTEPVPSNEVAKPEPRTSWTPPDEGDRLTDDEYDAIRVLCGDAPHIIDTWHAEALDAHRPITLKGHRSQRRAEIIVAALAVAQHLHDPNGTDLIDAALQAVGAERQAGMTTGAALGSLTILEARRLGELARAFGAGEVQPITDEHGTFRFAA